MPSRNPNFYNANETRPYPLSASATLLSTNGDRLPHDIIVDMNLRYPRDLGEYPYLASVGVTDQLVSVTVQAAQSLSDTSSLAPIAALGLVRPIIEGRPYALESQYPGAAGWVVFGSGIQENFSGRFLGPSAGLLMPRTARAYRTLPVTSLSKLHALTALTGLVQLSGQSPIEIVKEEREVNGVNQDVVVVRLTQPAGSGCLIEETSIFQELLGKCSGRPESISCGDPRPIEFLNTVQPDCNGNINIEFRGCAELARVLDDGGVMLDCELGLGEACATDRLADNAGRLRTDYPDECNSDSYWDPPRDRYGAPTELGEVNFPSDSFVVLGSLPYYECFLSLGDLIDWELIDGAFTIVGDTSPYAECWTSVSASLSFSAEDSQSYESTNLSTRNIVVWSGFDTTTENRRCQVDVKIINAASGSKKNAGIVVNYRPHQTIPGLYQYYLVELDYDSQEFRVRFWNGTNFSTTAAFASVPGLSLGAWYRLSVEVADGIGDSVTLIATLDNVDAPALSATLGPFSTATLAPADGDFGLYASRSQTRFSAFQVEDITP